MWLTFLIHRNKELNKMRMQRNTSQMKEQNKTIVEGGKMVEE